MFVLAKTILNIATSNIVFIRYITCRLRACTSCTLPLHTQKSTYSFCYSTLHKGIKRQFLSVIYVHKTAVKGYI